MRLQIVLELTRQVRIPINHQQFLTGVVYHFLETADADYAAFLHTEGYSPGDETDNRRFKLFTFSNIRTRKRRAEGNILVVGPGPAEWIVASPVEKFLREFATGLLSIGVLRVGGTELRITQVEAAADPEFGEIERFVCLTPIVASVTKQESRTPRYLMPDDPEFSERVRLNLISKHIALYGSPPLDDRLTLIFKPDYLATHKSTRLIEYKPGIHVRGAFAPFTLEGSPELMRVGYSCGFGEKNSGGFGMAEREGN